MWTIPHFIFNRLGYPFGIFILVITFVYEIFRIVLNAKIILILKEEMDQSQEALLKLGDKMDTILATLQEATSTTNL